jgi:hypothetical protein
MSFMEGGCSNMDEQPYIHPSNQQRQASLSIVFKFLEGRNTAISKKIFTFNADGHG